MARPKQRTPELKSRLLRSALATIETEGPTGLTVRRVASDAQTSPPALYELFGDRAGLVGEIFIAGFLRLAARLRACEESTDPLRDLLDTMDAFRDFVLANPGLAEIMFSRPFADFDPGAEGLAVGSDARTLIVGRVRRCIDAGLLAGDTGDIAHVLFALARGLAFQQASGILGPSPRVRDRRWRLGLAAMLAGLAPG